MQDLTPFTLGPFYLRPDVVSQVAQALCYEIKEAETNGGKENEPQLGDVVGEDIYAVWVRMLQELVPSGRTHRLSVVLAGILQYAASVAESNQEEDEDDSSLASSLIQATEVGDPSEV